jgi:hypothetical protein
MITAIADRRADRNHSNLVKDSPGNRNNPVKVNLVRRINNALHKLKINSQSAKRVKIHSSPELIAVLSKREAERTVIAIETETRTEDHVLKEVIHHQIRIHHHDI